VHVKFKYGRLLLFFCFSKKRALTFFPALPAVPINRFARFVYPRKQKNDNRNEEIAKGTALQCTF
jgi:D-alanyl-lipoteichoic acid acyltransferase DltB (MBOAT superfamily)